jgi:hypothetical protein
MTMASVNDTSVSEGHMTAADRESRAQTSRAPGVPFMGLLLAAALIGCGGSADPASSSIGDLVVDDGRLPTLAEAAATEDWWLAPPGCEGMLVDGCSIAVASIEHGLVAAVDPSGEVVCVDTVEAVGEELLELGRRADAEELSTRYAATTSMVMQERPPASAIDRERYASDPHPEPSDCLNCGDPHPEPSMPAE